MWFKKINGKRFDQNIANRLGNMKHSTNKYTIFSYGHETNWSSQKILNNRSF